MVTKNDELYDFADSFMHHLLNEVDFEEKTDEVEYDPLEKLIFERDALYSLHLINNLSAEEEQLLKDYVVEYWGKSFKQANIPPKEQEAFIDTVFLSKGSISSDEQSRYQQLIQNFQNSQSIDELYFLGSVFGEQTYDSQNILKSVFNNMGKSQRAEAMANISVFVEYYSKTALGQKFIRKINDKDTETWFSELLDTMKKHSPYPLKMNYNHDQQTIDFKQQGSGLYDGLFFLPVPNSDDQLQINATARLDSAWESDSIQRHMLSSLVIAKSLDLFFQHKVNDDNREYFNRRTNEPITNEVELAKAQKARHVTYDFSRARSNKDKKGNIYNAYMAETIVQAVNEFIGESFNDFQTMLKSLNQNPLYYIKDALKIEDNRAITQADLDFFADNMNDFITNQSFFLSHVHSVKKTQQAKNSSLWQNEFENGDMTPEEFRVKAQCLGFLGQYIKEVADNQSSIDLDAIYNLFETNLKIRITTPEDNIHNQKFEHLNLRDFEATVMTHFAMDDPETVRNNHIAVGKDTRDNINDYLYAFITYHNEHSFELKMKELGFDNPPTFQEMLKNISACGHGSVHLRQYAQVKASELNKNWELTQEKEVNLINQGLAIKNYEPNKYGQFIQNNGLSQETQQMIEQLHNDNYNGSTQPVDATTLEDYKNFDFPDINAFQTSNDTAPPKQTIENKEQKTGITKSLSKNFNS